MKNIPRKIKPARCAKGKIIPPGDKSISHRAVMIGSIAANVTRVENFLSAEDCLATIEAFKKMGVDITLDGKTLFVKGAGLKGLKKPASSLYLANSGTTMRLLLGILAGQDFESTLCGDESLSRRPMRRVTLPLRQMGADIRGKDDADFAPLVIRGGGLRAIDYTSPVASAQIKSSILLAGIYAEGVTSVTEPFKSRDHTERMLALFNADISVDKCGVSLRNASRLEGKNIKVPGDISSAAFFIIMALLLKNSQITIEGVGCNETRTGIIDILKRMGGKIEIKNIRNNWEPACDLVVTSSRLNSTTVEKDEIPRTIDELPVLMIAAAAAKGRTVIKGAGELRVKETDRISSMQHNLDRMGGRVITKDDEIIIEGTGYLHGAALSSFGDHRTAMACAVAGRSLSSEESTIDDVSCVNTSFPEFFDIIESLSA